MFYFFYEYSSLLVTDRISVCRGKGTHINFAQVKNKAMLAILKRFKSEFVVKSGVASLENWHFMFVHLNVRMV